MDICENKILSSEDPEPIETINPQSSFPVLLVCEHAGKVIPVGLNNLGISSNVLESHRGWDIGAADVARQIAFELGAPLIIQRYSRLVFDCNRPPESTDAIPKISAGIEIPGNIGLKQEERSARQKEIFDPMNSEIENLLNIHKRVAIFSIHSFTKIFNGETRPWNAGFLTRTSIKTAEFLMSSLSANRAGLTLAFNEPYQIQDDSDWLIPRFAEPRQLDHCLIEICNKELEHPDGIKWWAGALAQAIHNYIKGDS